MTMNVLQIQLRSLTAMDIVAYGGAAAGVGVAIWQYANGAALPLAGVLLIVLLFRGFLHSAAPIGVVLPCCDERHDFNQAYFRIA